MIWLATLSPQWWQSLTTEWTSSIGGWTMCSSLLFWWLPLRPRLLHTSARMMEGSCRLLWHHCFLVETDSFSNTVKRIGIISFPLNNRYLYLTILTFFWGINSQFWGKMSELRDKNSQFWEKSQNTELYLAILRRKDQIVSDKLTIARKGQNCDIKSHNLLFYFLFHGRKKQKWKM